MRAERFTLAGDPGQRAAELRGLVPAPGSVAPAVAEIIAGVRAGGDEALLAYTRRFDAAEPESFLVDKAALARSAAELDSAITAGLELAIDNVKRVAEAEGGLKHRVAFGKHEVRLRSTPVASAAVYVPGGRAPYPSTVVMGAATARVAGVPEVVVCSPPPIDDVILAACWLVGVTQVYRMGGAQAIAALAYGTQSVAPVDVIVGPGNLYVQEAKRQVSGQVGIDGFAGPSDLVVIADGDADAELVALDLLAQAEHGEGTLVVGVSPSTRLLDELSLTLDDAPETGAVAALVGVRDAQQALTLAESLAPEHLQLVGSTAEALAPEVTRAGCLFVGAAAATAFGDYVAGSNHILPTDGAARFASGLSPGHFRRRFAEVRIDDADALAKAAAPVARAEGFELHARSMEARIRDNG
jgi:histidinol dehydrogenase